MQLRNSFGLWWKPENYQEVVEKSPWWTKFKMKWFGFTPTLGAAQVKNKPTIVQWFHDNGIYHTDDMSLAIEQALMCKIKGRKFDIAITRKKVNKHWKEQRVDPLTFKS